MVPHGRRRVTYVGNYGTIQRRFVGQISYINNVVISHILVPIPSDPHTV